MKKRRMWLNGFLIFFLNSILLAQTLDFEAADIDIDVEEEWDSLENFTSSGDEDSVAVEPLHKGGLTGPKPRPPLKLPEYVKLPASQHYKEYFTPERRSRPVPPLVKSILLPAVPPKKPATSCCRPQKMVEVLCHLDRLYLRVVKSLFTNPNAHKHLKLGTCSVTKATAAHYYFLCYLNRCGFKREEDVNRVTYTSTLNFRPVATGPIVRELPFTVPIRCTYTKFHRSYQVGFLPKMADEILYRSLQTGERPSLSAMDASWKLLTKNQSFVLGKPICFEAKGPRRNVHRRLYLNSCVVTPSPSHQSTEKYSIIKNYGCLVDSMSSTVSKFHTSTNKMTVRFCIAAFMFKNIVSLPNPKKTMFIHCELDIGPETPTPTAKSCTYDAKTRKWTELSGATNVCNCCESTCPGPQRASDKALISSKSWDLNLEMETPIDSKPEISFSNQDDFEFMWESVDY